MCPSNCCTYSKQWRRNCCFEVGCNLQNSLAVGDADDVSCSADEVG